MTKTEDRKTQVELDEANDGLDGDARLRLHDALMRSEEDVRAGRVVDAEEFLAERRSSKR